MMISLIGLCALLLALPGCFYLTILSIAALFLGNMQRSNLIIKSSKINFKECSEFIDPTETTKEESLSQSLQVVILIPAHNEAAGIGRTLQSLEPQLAVDRNTRVFVIADNCTDDTAQLARDYGASVLERHDPDRRGKGYALQFGFAALTDADWFIVIDADTDVAPGFLCAMRQSMLPAAGALQCRYRVRDPLAHPRATLADIALAAWNVVRLRGRSSLGLSVGILGNGFALSQRLLQSVPFRAGSIVEDVEYHHALINCGWRVRWVDQAQVEGEMPSRQSAASAQRARWEGGRLRLLLQVGPGLVRKIVSGQMRWIDPLADLLLWPLAWQVCLLAIAWLFGGRATAFVAMLGMLALALHVLLAMWVIRAGPAHWRALLGVPAYIIWKLSLALKTWRAARRDAPWTGSRQVQS